MKNIIKAVSLLTIVSVIPAAFAATSRISVSTKASPRLPSIAGYIVSANTANTVRNNTTNTTAAYYGDSDCIEKYTDCIKADDVCGSDFQECTTNVLFHGQMSKCLSTLYQCSSSGINALFGTSAINALSNVASTQTVDGVQEVTRYTYPTDGSVLGQLIIGAGITNQLTTEQCVRRYTNCLKRDDICGEDFELCTDNRAFRKQALLCDSTLQRCQNDGKTQIFGSVANASKLAPSTDSRLGQLIAEGSSKAALNAVKTCQKVTDNCLINACLKNPFRCVEGVKLDKISAADIIAGGDDVFKTVAVSDNDSKYTEATTASDVRKMLKTQCLETIGTNKYCHMTYLEKANVSDRDLADPDLQEEVFSLAYSARQGYANTKIQEEIKKFDTNAKNSCFDTIKSCAMRSCGGGLGSVCYRQARSMNTVTLSTTSSNSFTIGSDGKVLDDVHVNRSTPYSDIKSGCSAIVNADANCIYAATAAEDDGYQYAYTNNSVFDTLFPAYTGSETDAIGAVGKLNAILATSYNDAAIEDMKKQCQTVALSCVKSMCGKDYVNCYRNRTDIISGSYDTDSARFDRSMNKMGGVIDYNIVMGLCMNTVKTSSVCEEHLKIATADWRNSKDAESWGNNTTVREAWLGANTTKVKAYDNGMGIVVACRAKNVSIGEDIDCSGTMEPNVDSTGNNNCNGVMDGEGCVYDEPVYQSQTEFVLENSAKTLFQQLLVDVEKEAQAKYNAKLTKEQNICLANNGGGVMGNADTGSTFMWVKLKSNKVPKNYENNGLTTKQFVASNDLYGSFCRAKITVLSDDKDIQELLGNRATAYFAVGDAFTCGSWIKESELRRISDMVGERELCKQGYGKWSDGKCNGSALSTKEKVAYTWATVAPAIAGLGLGLGLTESGLVSKMIASGNKNNSISEATIEKWQNICTKTANDAIQKAGAANDDEGYKGIRDLANGYAAQAYTACDRMGIQEYVGCHNNTMPNKYDEAKIKDFKGKMEALKSACKNFVTTEENGRAMRAARVAVPIATTLAGAGLGAGITASVMKTKRESIKNEAAQKWMEEVGDHIQCYLGADELGSYGDVVSIELD